MTDIPLSAGTRVRLNALFSEPDRNTAEQLLRGFGADFERPDSHSLERVRFAVLKLSKGTLAGLERALAEPDWRDTLVAARFANDVHAHHRWTPNVSRAEQQAWQEGQAVHGVTLTVGTGVRITRPPFIGQSGRVSSLLAITPEPLYLLELSADSAVELLQSELVAFGS